MASMEASSLSGKDFPTEQELVPSLVNCERKLPRNVSPDSKSRPLPKNPLSVQSLLADRKSFEVYIRDQICWEQKSRPFEFDDIEVGRTLFYQIIAWQTLLGNTLLC